MIQAVSAPLQIRVALVSGGVKLGGATTFLCNFAGELIRREIPVEVFSFEAENPLATDFNRLGIPVFCKDERRFIFEDRLISILQGLNRFKPTVVVANLSAQSFEVLRYVPVGVFRVGVAHADHSGVYEMIRHYPRYLDLISVVSETIKIKIQAMPEFSNLRVLYLPLGVPMPDDAKTERDFHRPLRILYLGRLDREQKRVHLFPAILTQLRASGIPFHWTIAGSGPDQTYLEREMKGAPNQSISFPGRIPYSEVPSLLLKNDVFLLTSDYEGLPLGLLEAMGCGLVPVVSDLSSGIRELVDETTGKRVSPEDVNGYAQAIVWLHERRDHMQRLSHASRQKVQREYSISAMADRWLRTFPIGPISSKWPGKWSIQPPLGADGKLRFSSPARMLRRLLFRFRRQVFELQRSTPS